MKRGFTLIELMVSVTIFTMVMVVSLGALLTISASERKAETLKSVMTNLNFALDSMSRSIRTGSNYDGFTSCNPSLPISGIPTPTDCTAAGGSYAIAFQAIDASLAGCPASGTPCIVVYCRGAGSTCSSSGTSLLRSTDGGNNFSAITAPEVQISNLSFYVRGAPRGDGIQPIVTITLSGYIAINGDAATQNNCLGQVSSGATGQCSAFNIQTSATQRIYDQ
ncbi:MAG TPA: type II secretion system protein [Candidatus Paceibacterota bacterium]|nr:type II secretion system protein [Candidatus Paceibacterota bacterium]